VSVKSTFEVSIMHPGYLPAVKMFTVAPGSKSTWTAHLEVKKDEDEGE
jgi:hypothetical protein